MIEFLLGVVQAVMGGVLSDLISSKRSAVRRREIEAAVEATIRERQASLDSERIAIATRSAMTELLKVVERDPGLRWRFAALRLVNPVEAVPPPLQQQILGERLARLQFLISERRKVLSEEEHRSAPDDPAPVKEPDGVVAPVNEVVWEQVESSHQPQQATSGIEELRRRVWERRTGREDRVANND